MKLVVVVGIAGRSRTTLDLAPHCDRDSVEGEIREALLQETFIELDLEEGGVPSTLFLNVSPNLLSVAVTELPNA